MCSFFPSVQSTPTLKLFCIFTCNFTWMISCFEFQDKGESIQADWLWYWLIAHRTKCTKIYGNFNWKFMLRSNESIESESNTYWNESKFAWAIFHFAIEYGCLLSRQNHRRHTNRKDAIVRDKAIPSNQTLLSIYLYPLQQIILWLNKFTVSAWSSPIDFPPHNAFDYNYTFHALSLVYTNELRGIWASLPVPIATTPHTHTQHINTNRMLYYIYSWMKMAA